MQTDQIDMQWLEDQMFKRPLESGEKHVLEQAMRVETYQKGDVLIAEGEQGDGLCLLRGGRVGVYHQSHGEEVRIGEAGEGAQLGDMASFGDGVASATVRALEECTVYRLPRQPLIHLMTYRQRLARDIMMNTIRQLAEIVRGMNRNRAFSQQYISGQKA